MFRWHLYPRSRHPLVRLLAAAIGAIALLALLAFGFIAAIALLVGGGIVLLVKAMRASSAGASTQTSRPPPPPGVIEGEFRVVHDARADRQPAR